jgi:HD-GYP domain-containing protein (c-di-GMP phosphodiesterase class II)
LRSAQRDSRRLDFGECTPKIAAPQCREAGVLATARDVRVKQQIAAESGVNSHFLDHMVNVSATHLVEATEDIYAGNGMKLLRAGTPVDAQMRERLLEHKLTKPLEECVHVVDGVIPGRFKPIVEELLEDYPLLRTLCAHERAAPVAVTLSSVAMSTPTQSLLTVYAAYREDRLRHTVGVAMLALALGRKLLAGDVDAHRTLTVAGLVHDIGELYIDPAYLREGSPLGPEQWRHIVTHPLVAHRVLAGMAGAGKAVADAVLYHHERLDGFGYPYGVRHRELPLHGQILAVAEWLMALVESDGIPLSHARLSAALMPGEFNASVIAILADAARGSNEAAAAEQSALPPLDDVFPRVRRIADTLLRFEQSRAWIDAQIARAAPAVKELLEIGLERMLRIRSAYFTTGLDTTSPEATLRQLVAAGDVRIHVEVVTVVREIGWRLRELEREQLLRATALKEADQALVRELVGRFKGSAAPS